MKEGWTYKKLGEVCKKITDGSHNPPKGVEKSHNYMLSSQNVQDGYLDMSSVRYLSDEEFRIENQRTQAKQGDVLLTIVGTIGRTCVLDGTEENITFQRSVAILKPSEEINSRFLMFFLLSQNTKLNSTAQGAAQKGIYLKQLGNVEIHYPYLSEQQAIVTRLDAAFAKIDALKANAEKQLSEARKLFQAELTECMRPKEGWKMDKVGNIFKTYAGGTPIKSNIGYYENGNIPWLRSGEICKQYITGCEMFITEMGMKNSSAKYYPVDTILVAMYGATAAQVGILKFEATSNQAVCGILPKKDFVPEFVYYWFKNIQKDLAAQAQGGAQPNISQIKIKNVDFPIINKEEQHQIVTRLDALSANIKKLEKVQQKTIAECDALKQAMLREVFE